MLTKEHLHRRQDEDAMSKRETESGIKYAKIAAGSPISDCIVATAVYCLRLTIELVHFVLCASRLNFARFYAFCCY